MHKKTLFSAIFAAALYLSSNAGAALLYSGWIGIQTAPVNGATAFVDENIMYDTISRNYDYLFLVANNGARAIDGFFGGPGTLPVGAPNYASAFGGAEPGAFPAVVPGGALPPFITTFFGATNPLNPCIAVFNPLFPSAPCSQIASLPPWGFEEFTTNAGAGYLARWFTQAGYPFGPLPVGFYTRFDLVSRFGPVPGGSWTDPFSGGIFGVDDGLGDLSMILTPTILDPNESSCDPTQPNCSAFDLPTNIPNFSSLTAFGPVPEPVSIALMGSGLLGLGLLRRKRA